MTPSGKNRAATMSIDRLEDQSGFSLLEVLVVVGIVIILTAMAVFSLTSSKRSYAPDEEAAQAVSFFREAYHRALSQRQTMRVSVDLDKHIIRLMDEGRLPGGDEVEIIRGVISHRVSIEQPSIDGAALNPPPAPYNYAAANFKNKVWAIRFRSDGSVVDSDGNPLSATLFFIPTNLDDHSKGLIRAVTLYGPTGAARLWKLDAATNKFVAGGD
jgi:type II secretory pathway pseudopilin PulG